MPRRLLNRMFCRTCMEYIPGLLFTYPVIAGHWAIIGKEGVGAHVRSNLNATSFAWHRVIGCLVRGKGAWNIYTRCTIILPPLYYRYPNEFSKKVLWIVWCMQDFNIYWFLSHTLTNWKYWPTMVSAPTYCREGPVSSAYCRIVKRT